MNAQKLLATHAHTRERQSHVATTSTNQQNKQQQKNTTKLRRQDAKTRCNKTENWYKHTRHARARARESARAECDKVYRYVGSLFAFRILFLEKLDQRRFVFVVQRLAPTKSTKQKQNKTKRESARAMERAQSEATLINFR